MNTETVTRSFSWMEWLCAFGLFIGLNPYFTWQQSAFAIFPILASMIPIYIAQKRRGGFIKDDLGFFFFFVLLFLWYVISKQGSVLGIAKSVTPALFLLIHPLIRKSALDCFVYKLLPIVLFISASAYILDGIGLIHLPTIPIVSYNESNGALYFSHILYVQQGDIVGLSRFCSLFDEPGVVGTICSLVLFCYAKELPKWTLAVYIVSGILSLSLFFFVMFTYLLVVGKMGFNVKSLFFVGIIVYVGAMILINNVDSDYLQLKVLSRLQIEDGSLVGDNRLVDGFSDYFWGTFVNSPDLLFGTKDTFNRAEGSSSILKEIYLHGLLFVLLSLAGYIRYFYRHKRSLKEFILFLVFFIGLMYQRPYLWSFVYFVFFIICTDYRTDSSYDSSDNSR